MRQHGLSPKPLCDVPDRARKLVFLHMHVPIIPSSCFAGFLSMGLRKKAQGIPSLFGH